MTADLIKKLATELDDGINTELQVVYLMAGIRKLLEEQGRKTEYGYLKFHCDWALHTKLEGTKAQEVLKCFDAANICFKSGVDVHDLPGSVGNELENLSQMKFLKRELQDFLKVNGLSAINKRRGDGWSHFLHLYTCVIKDCPLVISAKNNSNSTIKRVTVSVELANRSQDGHMFFKVSWIILDKNGLTGELFILNSFSIDKEEHPTHSAPPPPSR